MQETSALSPPKLKTEQKRVGVAVPRSASKALHARSDRTQKSRGSKAEAETAPT